MNNFENGNVELLVYDCINQTANNNLAIQGISGLIGFPATLVVDGAVLFTHYAPMINRIRTFYGRNPIEKDALIAVTKGVSSELLFDFAFDKIAGQIPIAGIYFNAICAKAMTWRLGILFAILSAQGDTVTQENVSDLMKLIRNVFPQKDIFKFVRPDYNSFEKLLHCAYDSSEFESKINKALKVFEDDE